MLLAASQFWHTFLALRHQLWSRGMAKWEDGLRLGVGGVQAMPGLAKLFALVAHPAGQECLRVIVDPLVKQRGNLSPQVGGTIEPRQLEALERGDRRIVKKVPRRSEDPTGHDYAPIPVLCRCLIPYGGGI